MARIVILNSPPRGGKDHGASFLTKLINDSDDTNTAVHREMKNALIDITATMLGMSRGSFLKNYDAPCSHSKTGWFKDVPMYIVADNPLLSKRQALIHMSERVVKPFFGKEAFGLIEANKVGSEHEDYVFYSDGGFPEEVYPLIEKVGAENVMVIRIHKEGCSFEGDSRQYLTSAMFPPDACPVFVELDNVHGEVEQFESNLADIIIQWEKSFAQES